MIKCFTRGGVAGAITSVTLLLLSACGGAGGGNAPIPMKLSCDELGAAKVDAAAIGLPTTGAVVTSAVSVASGGTGSAAFGSHCLVSGDIKPVDSTAPNIKFQLALPDSWNGKVVMLGGSGFNGSIPSVVTSSSIYGNASFPTPLNKGYAVFASDSGHQTQSGASPATFALNAESYRNFSGDALKKTRDVSLSLLTSHYGRSPTKSYFLGYSKGGGEALIVGQRWPADWDGIVAGAPAWNFTEVGLHMVYGSQPFAATGAWLNEAKRTLLFSAVMEVCDALDGARDRLISNVKACEATFDPQTALLGGAALRCPNGVEAGDMCLSDVQLAALKAVNDGRTLTYKLQTGETRIAGLPIYMADNGGSANTTTFNALLATGSPIGAVAPAFPSSSSMSFNWTAGVEFMKYVVTRDPSFNALNFNVATGSGYAARLDALSALDGTVTDLSPFKNRAGKMLLWIGTTDMQIGTKQTEFYYSRMQSTMGAENVDSFVRFYEVPGYGHGTLAATFVPSWDQLSILEDWVERSIDPADNVVMSDTAGVPGRTRPMCRYPSFAKYKGSGDINTASSFTCARS